MNTSTSGKCAAIVLLFSALAMPVSDVYAQAQARGPAEAQIALAPKIARMRDLALAAELARYGKARSEPLALLAAARIVLDVGWEPINVEGTGSKASGSGFNLLDASAMLEEAKRLAGGQPTILALVTPLQDRAARTPRGAEGGIKLAGGTLPARGVHSYNVTFTGGQPASVYVTGSREAASAFQCAIFDGKGRRIATKDDVECLLTWWPNRRDTYRIEVRNARRADRPYLFMTN